MTESADRRVRLRVIRDFIRLLRPEFWLVCLLPCYLGFVLASKELLPNFAWFIDLVHWMFRRGYDAEDFVRSFGGWVRAGTDFWFAIIALGPCIWGATLLFNDYWDLELDRHNPRRQHSPLVLGRLQPPVALWGSAAVAIVGLTLAAPISPTFFVFMAGATTLGWAYSAPPFRLKTRPGFDVAVNAIGIGVGCALAGWSLRQPLQAFPWIFLLQSVLLLVSLYLPSMMWDYEYDKALGARTFVVVIGPQQAYIAGLALFTTSIVGAIGLAWANFILPRAFLFLFVPASALMIWQYVHYIGGWRDPARLLRGIVYLSITIAVVHVVFLFMYTGIWRV
ncbi:MAG TPA: UbiA prenyltransferase family protein [Candidatus Thermoplasmatota archaeon]